MTKKEKVKSLLEPNGYEESFDRLLKATKSATDSERQHAFKVGGFLFNGFVYIARHLISMMSDCGSDIGIEQIDGKTMKSMGEKKGKGLGGGTSFSEKERLSMLVGFFVSFCYELLSPAIEVQDKYGRGCSIDVDKLARDVGVITNEQTFKIGQPMPSENGVGVLVPVAIENKNCDDKDYDTNRDKLEKLIGKDGVEGVEAMLNDKKLRDKLHDMMMNAHLEGADA